MANAGYGADSAVAPPDRGRRVYQEKCAGCHGPEGDLVPGAALLSGNLRRARTDRELAAVIRHGIEGTAMRPVPLKRAEMVALIGYLRRQTRTRGGTVSQSNRERGRRLYEQEGGCVRCHRVEGVGSRLGPDLSEIGRLRNREQLKQSLLEPDAEVRNGNRMVRVSMASGETVFGRLLNQDTFTLQLIDANERLLSLPKETVKRHELLTRSQMPSYRGQLGEDELEALIDYLSSLRGSDIR